MKKIISLLTGLLIFSICTALPGYASKREKASSQPAIYAFGYATVLADSVAYISAIQQLPGAKLESQTGFLLDSQQYSQQMEKALSSQFGGYFTCAVIYAKSKAKAEKKYLQYRKRSAARTGVKIYELPKEDFAFTALRQ